MPQLEIPAVVHIDTGYLIPALVKDSHRLRRGEKVHFFEVIEQRGAVREGKFKEFQVKLKVAVEA